MTHKTKLTCATVVVSFLGVSAAAEAAPIIYSESATISGSLNGEGFSNNVITLTGLTNTLNIFNAGCCFIATLNVSFSVTGIGSGNFTDAIRVVSNRTNGSAGFGDINLNRAILFTVNPVFSSYNLASPIGPIVGTASFNSGFAFPTSAGSLIILSSSDPTFTAVNAPLPAAAWLLASALGVLGWMRRKVCRPSGWIPADAWLLAPAIGALGFGRRITD